MPTGRTNPLALFAFTLGLVKLDAFRSELFHRLQRRLILGGHAVHQQVSPLGLSLLKMSKLAYLSSNVSGNQILVTVFVLCSHS